MNKLIKNELIKIFSKKSMIVFAILILVFIAGYNILYKYSQNNYGEMYSDSYISYLEEQLKELDPNNTTDVTPYVEIKTQIDIAKLSKGYLSNSWEQNVIEKFISPIINEMNTYEYIDKDTEKLEKIKNEYNNMCNALKGDWKYFANIELANLDEQINNIKNSNISDSETEIQLKNLELQKEVVNLRLDKNIEYGTEKYKSFALQNYQMNMFTYNRYVGQENLDENEKREMNEALKTASLYKYDLDNNKEYQNTNTANYNFQRTLNTYIVIIVMIVVIIAGISISEEFNKGTVKLLLVRPYSRTKILLSKLISVLITMVITTLFVLVLQFVIGGFTFGFNTYYFNISEFDFNTNTVIILNIFKYISLIFISKLPIFILIGTLAFALSTISLNSPLAIAFPILGYTVSDMINVVALEYNWDWVKYFVTPNWDLSQYLFGGMPLFKGISIEFSILISIIYFVIMIGISIEVFKRRNIKNV